jgi:cell division protein FtsQ
LRLFRAPRLAAIVVGLVVISAAAWWVTHTPLFDMRTLTVRGNRHLSEALVARLAGLSRSTNVVWLRSGAVADRIERNPWVLRARVSKSLPGSVTVVIEERRAVAFVESGRSPLLVSGDGVILGRARGRIRLPLVTLPPAPVSTGGRLGRTPDVLIVARTLPAGIRGKVERITQEGPGSLMVILRNGARVLYGDASEAGAKGRALSSLLSWAKKRGIRVDHIDVRAPSAPALLPSGAAASS